MKYLLSIDLGTTAIKVAIFDEMGKKQGDSTQEYTLITPSPLVVEQKFEVYWDAFKAGLSESLKKAGLSGEQITALSVSALVNDSAAALMNVVLGRAADASLPLALCMGGVACLTAMALFARAARRG